MPDGAVLSVAFAVSFLPGAVLLSALGLRRDPVLLLALSPAVSVAMAGLCGVLTGWLGLPFGVLTFGALTLLAGGAVLVATRRRGDRPSRPRRRPVREQVVQASGFVLVLGGVVAGVATWLRGLGGLATVPQEHDMVVHTLLTSYISRTGRGAPWEVLPLDVVTGEPVYFYPAGMHLLAAVVTDVTGDAVTAINSVTVILLAVVLSVSAAALTWVAAGRLRLGRGSAAVAASMASLVAAGLYRPTFQLAHDGGGLPNAAALAMTPAVVAGLLMLPTMSRRAAVGVGLACVGVVWVHPSAAVSVGVTAVAWWAGDAFIRRHRRDLRGLPGRLLIAGGTAGLLLVPLVLSSASAASRTTGFPADTAAAGLSGAVGSTLGLAYGGYLDPPRATGQLWAAALVAVGVAAVLMLRRGFGPVGAWGVWTSISVAYFLSPSSGPETVITDFFYKALVRVWSHVSLLVPVLAGLGVVLAVNRLAILLRRSRGGLAGRVRAPWIAVPLAVLAFAAYAVGPGLSYARVNTEAVASRYGEPDFVRVGPDDRRAGEWLDGRIAAGERVLNSPNDGSTFLYVEYGIPVVNVYPLGLPQAPYSYELLRSFNRYPLDREIRNMLLGLNVTWVYVDSRAPVIGAAGSPEGWAGDGVFDLAPGLQDLDGLPGLRREFRSGSVSIYSLDLGLVAELPAGV